jgi:predicted RNase H-like nuclease (RuvC/YqgF family)
MSEDYSDFPRSRSYWSNEAQRLEAENAEKDKRIEQLNAKLERVRKHASETMRLLNWDQLGWDVPEEVIEELSKALTALEDDDGD